MVHDFRTAPEEIMVENMISEIYYVVIVIVLLTKLYP